MTVRIDDVVGRSSSRDGRPWLWPVFFAVDDTALAGLLSGRPEEEGVLHAHPPVTVAARSPNRGARRSTPPLALWSFDLRTEVLRSETALVGVAAVLERGDRPSEEARDAVDELVAGLRLTLARHLGGSLGLGSLLSAFAGGGMGMDPSAGLDPPEGALSLEDLERGSVPTPESGPLDRLAQGPVLATLRGQTADMDRERALGFSILSGLVADPDYEAERAYVRPPLVSGYRPNELGAIPEDGGGAPPDDPGFGRGPRTGDRPGRTRGGRGTPIRPDLGRIVGRMPPGLRRNERLGIRVPPRIGRPVPLPDPSPTPDLPRRFHGLRLDQPVTLPELTREGGAVIGSGFAFWTPAELAEPEARGFRTRLHGERGARVSFVMRGTVRVTPRAEGRPTGWSRGRRGGSHLVVPSEDGSISVYLRGAGAAEHETLSLEPDAFPVGRISGGALGKQHLIAWRDAAGRIRSAERTGGGSWVPATVVDQDGAVGAPTLLADAARKRWALAYGAEGGGVHVAVSRGRRWKRMEVGEAGREVEQVALAALPAGERDNEGLLWAAWAGADGTPMMASETRSGSWKVSGIRAAGSLPPVAGGPLALADPTGRLPALAYRAPDGLVLLLPSRGRWRVERPKLPTLPRPVGDIDGVTIPAWKSVALGFRSADGGIHLVLRDGDGTWRHEPLRKIPATPGGGSDPCLWVAGRNLHVGWLDERGHVWEASRAEDGTWRSADIDALSDASESARGRS
ncbi:MAG: hypothetical protein U5R14_07720 [Gemmatimonadota bacterium]|nr:hypothetical protein [Gemmatimonadota bacterium]